MFRNPAKDRFSRKQIFQRPVEGIREEPLIEEKPRKRRVVAPITPRYERDEFTFTNWALRRRPIAVPSLRLDVDYYPSTIRWSEETMELARTLLRENRQEITYKGKVYEITPPTHGEYYN